MFARRRATVRNRSREVAMAVPLVSSAKGVTFGLFQLRVASFRVACVALCDISTCFMTCQKMSKVILCGRRTTFATFSEEGCIFRGRRSTWRPPMSFCVAGAAL